MKYLKTFEGKYIAAFGKTIEEVKLKIDANKYNL